MESVLLWSSSSLERVEVEALLFVSVTSTKSRRARLFIWEIFRLYFPESTTQQTLFIILCKGPIHLYGSLACRFFTLKLLLSQVMVAWCLLNLSGHVICLDWSIFSNVCRLLCFSHSGALTHYLRTSAQHISLSTSQVYIVCIF